MKESDEALEKLITYYSNVDEDTVILFFGDHQPKLESGFYDSLRKQHDSPSDLEWSEMKHRVPLMIWANYDLGTGDNAPSEDDIMSANYLTPYLKSVIGLPMTGFDKYLLDLKKDLPVISAICYEDNEGRIYDPSDPSEYDEKLNEYACIQYNGLIDTDNRISDFFYCKK